MRGKTAVQARSEQADEEGPLDGWLKRRIAEHDGVQPHEVTLEYIWEQREKRRAQELIRVDYHPLVGPPVYMTREELDRSVDAFLATL